MNFLLGFFCINNEMFMRKVFFSLIYRCLFTDLSNRSYNSISGFYVWVL